MMRKLSRKWPFRASMIADAPETAGLYALWDGETLLCLGHAGSGGDTIRDRLARHLDRAHAGREPFPTHYSWEICRNPLEREAEARAELGWRDACQLAG
jgi:hypothetical protein